jgi:hypothetical protein
MRGFLAVFEREIVERRLLLVAALVLGLVPLLAPLLPGMPPARPAELRSGTALGIALVLTLALALLLGGSVIVRDLAERRLGFYFARPLSGTAIWAGKLAAAAALTVGAGLLVLLPATLVGGPPDPSGYWGTSSGVFQSGFSLAVIWFGVLLLTLTAAHAVSVMVRSRSPWLLLDLAALGVTSSVAGICLLILVRKGAGLPIYHWQRFGPGPAGGPTLLLYVEVLVALVALLALTMACSRATPAGSWRCRRKIWRASTGPWARPPVPGSPSRVGLPTAAATTPGSCSTSAPDVSYAPVSVSPPSTALPSYGSRRMGGERSGWSPRMRAWGWGATSSSGP